MEPGLHYGIYDALLDTNLKATLDHYPELRSVLGKIETEEQPARYADFVAKLIEQVLREEASPERRLANDFFIHPSCMRIIQSAVNSWTGNLNRIQSRNLQLDKILSIMNSVATPS